MRCDDCRLPIRSRSEICKRILFDGIVDCADRLSAVADNSRGAIVGRGHIFYRQDAAAKRQTAGIKFTHRPKIRFFAPQGRLVALIYGFMSNLAGPTGTLVRLVAQNLTSIATGGGWECSPKNIKNFHFLIKSRPTGATPLTDFENF